MPWWPVQAKLRLNPCHTILHSHCIARALFIFPDRCEIARKIWHFSWRWRCHVILTATKALLGSSHSVLFRSYGVLFCNWLCFHYTSTVFSQCSHCADSMLKARILIYTNLFIFVMLASMYMVKVPWEGSDCGYSSIARVQ